MESKKCSECNGKGYNRTKEYTFISYYFCDKCKGWGNLDWIEQLKGKTSKSFKHNLKAKHLNNAWITVAVPCIIFAWLCQDITMSIMSSIIFIRVLFECKIEYPVTFTEKQFRSFEDEYLRNR